MSHFLVWQYFSDTLNKKSFQDTVWCQGCVTVIVDGCQDKSEPRNKEDDQKYVAVEEELETVLILGGYSHDHVSHVETVSTDQCQVQDMTQPRSRAVSGQVGGVVLTCGGRTRDTSFSDTCHVLDPVTGTWSDGPQLTTGREDAGVSVLGDNMMVVTGGWDGDRLLDSVEVYNSDVQMWQEVDGWRLTEAR